ncbi:hypothetical protein EDC61_10587 [Sulfuritortus calidifontis]|uniref:DUF2934 family protein n=1 Tax=Sulfuritortus calidifontis TaxID=1914471 RepID=A0A4R3JYS0_9PROT|nr:hypothetical protein [Sulfuritortus calidifontis]TCS72433.1 hypothetical protein EDC61_10587 [Sulfuritortus calidifontis]
MQTSEIKPSKKPAAKPKTAATKPAAAKRTTAGTARKTKPLDADLRHKLITETAHFLSEKRRSGASELDDWLFAEKLVEGVSGAIR